MRSPQGGRAEDVTATLSQLPHAEKFAKFWICKAKLLARSGPVDVKELYDAAAGAGAVVSEAPGAAPFPAAVPGCVLKIQGVDFGMSSAAQAVKAI